jgi:cytochrome c5
MRSAWVLGSVLVLGVIGCGGTIDSTPGGSTRQSGAAGADIWTSKCGACHERPQPKLRSRSYITDAMSRHHRRVSLDEDEWAAVIEFMSK